LLPALMRFVSHHIPRVFKSWDAGERSHAPLPRSAYMVFHRSHAPARECIRGRSCVPGPSWQRTGKRAGLTSGVGRRSVQGVSFLIPRAASSAPRRDERPTGLVRCAAIPSFRQRARSPRRSTEESIRIAATASPWASRILSTSWKPSTPGMPASSSRRPNGAPESLSFQVQLGLRGAVHDAPGGILGNVDQFVARHRDVIVQVPGDGRGDSK
jgi:hypothetical protein